MPLNPKGLSKGLFDRIKERVRDLFNQTPGNESAEQVADELQVPPEQAQGPASDIPTMLMRIRYAGRTSTLLYMKYNNTWRNVEPYSFRYRSKGMQPLFYGYCLLHNSIEAYRIDRIQDVRVTNQPFSARWSVQVS